MQKKIYRLRRLLGDIRNHFLRLKRHKLLENKKYDLKTNQLYPQGANIDEVLSQGISLRNENTKISPGKKMASIGTCFAEEFSHFLNRNNELGSYIIKEENTFSSSANWGRVYTIPNLKQIIEYSLSPDYKVITVESTKGFLDPLREYSAGYFSSKEEAEESILKHRIKSKSVFLEAEVLVITLGQNEVWFDTKGEFYWGSIPPNDIFKKERVNLELKDIDFQTNYSTLKECLIKLFDANPSLKIILTVSPVPAAATFFKDDVVSRSFAGKCNLRALTHQILNEFEDRVLYYPSFEMVLCNNPRSFLVDNRHVQFHVVSKIFNILKKKVLS